MKILGGRFLTEFDLKDEGFHSLGSNVQIHERASLYGLENIAIGNNVRIDDFTLIVASGMVKIGNHVHIASHTYLGGKYGIVMEDFSAFAAGSRIFTSSDDYSGEKLTNVTIPPEYTGGTTGRVILRRHVLIGSGTMIMPGCTIGEGTAVGAMSFVIKDLEPWGIYAGIPVKRIRERKKDLLILEQQLLAKERDIESTQAISSA